MPWICSSCLEQLNPTGDVELNAWGLDPAQLTVADLDTRAFCSACDVEMSREAQRDIREVLEERAARIRLARTIARGVPPAKRKPVRRSSARNDAVADDSRRDVSAGASAQKLDPAQTLTVVEVGSLLGMTKAAVYAAAARDQLPGKVKLGGRLRFRAAAVRKLVGATLNDGKAASPPPERERG